MPAEVRALFRHHAKGNSLFRNLGNGRFEDRSARTATGPQLRSGVFLLSSH
jgi:hypothetical protein